MWLEKQADEVKNKYNSVLNKEEIIKAKETLENIAKYMEELVNEK